MWLRVSVSPRKTAESQGSMTIKALIYKASVRPDNLRAGGLSARAICTGGSVVAALKGHPSADKLRE